MRDVTRHIHTRQITVLNGRTVDARDARDARDACDACCSNLRDDKLIRVRVNSFGTDMLPSEVNSIKKKKKNKRKPSAWDGTF